MGIFNRLRRYPPLVVYAAGALDALLLVAIAFYALS